MNLLSGVNQDFHRPQKSPGAYEWWHFDGQDKKTGFAFSLQFFAGNLFSAYYQDSLKTYWQKTKSPLVDNALPVNPPHPLDFCGVAFRIFHRGRLVGEALQEFPAKFLKASDQQGAVLLGPNRFNWDALGDPPSYVITFQAPIRGGQKLLRARLFFTPLTGEISNLPAPEVPATHTWVITAPRCHVEGTLQWCDAEGESEKEEGFVGLGYHDHHFGSVPLDRFVKSWRWGRAFLGDQTLVYSVQTPVEDKEKPESILVWLDKNKPALVERGTEVSLLKTRRNFFFLPHPKEIIVQGSEPIQIQSKQILSDGPVSLILEDQIESKAFKAQGLSTYLYTPRLSNRFFFPLLKGKTTVFTPSEEAAPASLNQPGGDVFTDRSALK